jgi:hypothetical protein
MTAAGMPPVPNVPQRVEVAGETIRLVGVAEEVADRFLAEFPDELDRHGKRGHEWCIHDNHYLLAWAAADAEGEPTLAAQAEWLAGVLDARGYPLARLARDLEIAADVVRERYPSAGSALAGPLLAAAGAVREMPTAGS